MTVAQVSGKDARGPTLAVLVKRSNGVPMEEALAKADAAGAVIASNKRLSETLGWSRGRRSLHGVCPCWSGTMTAYDKPDQKLGKVIEYTDSETGILYVFPVPEEHQGKKNVVLVAEHPNFKLETDGKTRIVQAKEIGVVPEFPSVSYGWYLGDSKYDIPTGQELNEIHFNLPKAARHVLRIEKRVGLVARGYYSNDRKRRFVFLDNSPSSPFGMAVVLPPVPKEGITTEDLKALCKSSAREIDVLLRTVRPDALEATRRLLQALPAVEIRG